jgi:DNA replication and repair protein RecF
MYIQSVTAVNFKNLSEVYPEFSPRLNCLIGGNGSGKTTLLDALYYLSFCKSFLNPNDHENISHNENYFLLQGKYVRFDSDEFITCGCQRSQKKQFKRNDKAYKRLADHIGLLPLVIISPSDTDLIIGGSDERRKFMDGVISQYNASYLDNLIRYNRALAQRNFTLKQFAAEKKPDPDLLSLWDSQLCEYAKKIHPEREGFIRKLIPVFQYYYSSISQGKETVGLVHQSDLYNQEPETIINESLPRDLALQFTSAGIHKDDLVLTLDGYPIKKTGSQGQKKTYLIALKLAEFEFIKETSGLKPILLLDDIFDKLDRNRVEQIVRLVSGDNFGQIFITDTNREHLDGIIRSMGTDYRIFNVVTGNITSAE